MGRGSENLAAGAGERGQASARRGQAVAGREHGEVGAHRLARRAPHGDEAFLAALAAHDQIGGVAAHRLDLEPQQFGHPQARGVGHLDQSDQTQARRRIARGGGGRRVADGGGEVVDALRSGRPPSPTRGAPLGTFRETARLLAGFDDTRPGAVSASGAGGAPTMAGLQAVREAES